MIPSAQKGLVCKEVYLYNVHSGINLITAANSAACLLYKMLDDFSFELCLAYRCTFSFEALLAPAFLDVLMVILTLLRAAASHTFF